METSCVEKTQPDTQKFVVINPGSSYPSFFLSFQILGCVDGAGHVNTMKCILAPYQRLPSDS